MSVSGLQVGAVVAWDFVLGGVGCVTVTISLLFAARRAWDEADPDKESKETAEATSIPLRKQGQLPVTIVTGFLGSGKTTLVTAPYG